MRMVLILSLVLASISAAFAADSTYRLKAGDTLEILVWQEEGMERQVIVAPDGSISFPLAGHLKVRGRTPSQVERALTARLKKFITDPLVTVTVREVIEREFDVYVLGQVKAAGKFTTDKPTTVMQALSMSGGLSEFAALRRIKVLRKTRSGEISMEFNYSDVQSGRDLSTNIYLRSGDVVVVPERGLFGGLFE